MSAYNASTMAKPETRKPSASTSRNGTFEKLRIPCAASRSIRGKVYFVRPAKRSGAA
jgi:hypothetical protein